MSAAHDHLPSAARLAAVTGAGGTGSPTVPSPVSPAPPERGYYTVCGNQLIGYYVLHPDGLTWETQPGDHPTMEAALSYADKLNVWLETKPDGSFIDPFFDPFVSVSRDTSVEALLRIIDKAEVWA